MVEDGERKSKLSEEWHLGNVRQGVYRSGAVLPPGWLAAVQRQNAPPPRPAPLPLPGCQYVADSPSERVGEETPPF
ncbi:hypothetical protein E2C01_013462 [Portunus trituberculatus]|uniref:Uncharacterized protein n=1 Tax=Portunus trituberculatus TaxID=210409 RepID=A0A5B7DHD6_PORTR|nr:hypothetical protein [Portunus trituberculatus]